MGYARFSLIYMLVCYESDFFLSTKIQNISKNKTKLKYNILKVEIKQK